MNSKQTVSDSELRERYLRLYSGAVNDILRFDYKMHAALPSEYQPLNRDMKLCGRAFTIKGAPDITTDGEFEMRAKMLEELPPESIVMWDCTGGTNQRWEFVNGTLRTQNNKGTYHLSDLPMPAEYPEWPTGEQVQRYLATYADTSASPAARARGVSRASTRYSLPGSQPIATIWSSCTFAPKPMTRSAKLRSSSVKSLICSCQRRCSGRRRSAGMLTRSVL